MYAALWRALPGPRFVRLLIVLLLLAGVAAVCFLWLFPLIAPFVPFNAGTVQSLHPPAPAGAHP